MLVSIDSLRADRCGHLGGSGRTPTIDYLAEEGLAFDRAVAPGPTTQDSMSVVHTGEFPGVPVDAGTESLERTLRRHVRAHTTLAQRFARRGYSTAAFTANPWTSRAFGYDEGFDRFEDFLPDDGSESWARRALGAVEPPGADAARTLLGWLEGRSRYLSWRRYFDEVRAWIRGAEEPYFLWVFLVDPHMPYLPSEANRTGSCPVNLAANAWLYGGASERGERLFRSPLVRAYDEAVRDADDFVAALRGEVGSDTLVGVHADHGELFGERGEYGHYSDLSEELVHVPFVVANGPTGRVEAPFSLRRLPDLLPRLAAGAGVDAAEALTAPRVRTRNYLPMLGVRGRDWTYVESPDGETLYERDVAGTERPVRAADGDHRLRTGRAVVDRWRDGLVERDRIADAAAAVAAEADL